MQFPDEVQMNDLPKDIMILSSMELNLPDLINLCRANKVWNTNVCENEIFWMKRFHRDFPHVPKDPNMSYKQQIKYIYKNDRFPGFKTPKGLPSFYDKAFEEQLIKEGIMPINTPVVIVEPVYVKPEMIEFIRGMDLGKVPSRFGSGTLNDLLSPLLKENILSQQVMSMLIALYLTKNSKTLKTGKKVVFNEVPQNTYKTDEYMNKTLGGLLDVIDKEAFRYVEGPKIALNAVRDDRVPPAKITPRIINMLKNILKVALAMKSEMVRNK